VRCKFPTAHVSSISVEKKCTSFPAKATLGFGKVVAQVAQFF
jgi:hypothetical protein